MYMNHEKWGFTMHSKMVQKRFKPWQVQGSHNIAKLLLVRACWKYWGDTLSLKQGGEQWNKAAGCRQPAGQACRTWLHTQPRGKFRRFPFSSAEIK